MQSVSEIGYIIALEHVAWSIGFLHLFLRVLLCVSFRFQRREFHSKHFRAAGWNGRDSRPYLPLFFQSARKPSMPFSVRGWKSI